MSRIRLPLALAAAALALGASAPAASAVSSYCSESGDSCYETYKAGGVRYISVRYAAKYMEKTKLCVKAPSGKRDCVTRPLKQDKRGIWGVQLRWSTNFPNRGKGTYTYETPSPKPLTFVVR